MGVGTLLCLRHRSGEAPDDPGINYGTPITGNHAANQNFYYGNTGAPTAAATQRWEALSNDVILTRFRDPRDFAAVKRWDHAAFNQYPQGPEAAIGTRSAYIKTISGTGISTRTCKAASSRSACRRSSACSIRVTTAPEKYSMPATITSGTARLPPAAVRRSTGSTGPRPCATSRPASRSSGCQPIGCASMPMP